MKQINSYIYEKLHIGKDIEHQSSWYYECDIEDVTDGKITSEEIDDRIELLGWRNDTYFGPPVRKNNVRNHNNKLWYAVYCYLYDVGPKKTEDIINYLKPGGSKRSEMFSLMRGRNIITAGTGKDKGLQFPNPPSKWTSR